MYVFLTELAPNGETTKRSLTMTFTSFVFFDLFNAYTCRHNTRPFYEVPFASNKAFLVAIGLSVIGQLLVVYFPPLQKVFRTEALTVGDLMYIVSLASSMITLDTIRKKFLPNLFTEIQQREYSPEKSSKVIEKGEKGVFMV
jgi:Ca2+-transporting ATPase